MRRKAIALRCGVGFNGQCRLDMFAVGRAECAGGYFLVSRVDPNGTNLSVSGMGLTFSWRAIE